MSFKPQGEAEYLLNTLRYVEMTIVSRVKGEIYHLPDKICQKKEK